ncbi:energy-coupling factor transporter transmembrane component T family protein [Antarcticirhabdus aurantiaca]|uniref:Energy-coupling factor transporter transmembrane component T n=1 Tax=Antarcticirhabdus aurantiaca TaxID=2606717 RepID=A0ACD4NSC0_9HYPH|nr:energy-coupling factor transporter transmembrane component T [Antarcticirhabdus aurantiaca]WAJ29775.1 energy-coupling factor transporter transmembrane component T [Jeongeuplla avenae]
MIVVENSGAGTLHRVPAGIKLIALFGLSIVVFATSSVIILAELAGIVVAGSLLVSRASVLQWLKSWQLLLTIAIVAGWTAYAEGFEASSAVLLRLGSLSLFATLVTTTTTVGQFINVITRCARPLETLGVGKARDIGLAIGLVIRFIPLVQQRYRDVADAHRARGLKLRVSTVLVPMIVGTMLNAEDIADALDARSIRSESHSYKQG